MSKLLIGALAIVFGMVVVAGALVLAPGGALGDTPFVSKGEPAPSQASNPWGSFAVDMVTRDETGRISTAAINFQGPRQWNLELMALEGGPVGATPDPHGSEVGHRRSQNADVFTVCIARVGTCNESRVEPTGRVIPPVDAFDANVRVAAVEGRDGWRQTESTGGVVTYVRTVERGIEEGAQETIRYDQATNRPVYHRLQRPGGTFLEHEFVNYRAATQ